MTQLSPSYSSSRTVWHERDRGYTVCGVKITGSVMVRDPAGAVTCKRCKKALARRVADERR